MLKASVILLQVLELLLVVCGLDAELLLRSDVSVAGKGLFDVRMVRADITSRGKGAVKLFSQLLTVLACRVKVELGLQIVSGSSIGRL